MVSRHWSIIDHLVNLFARNQWPKETNCMKPIRCARFMWHHESYKLIQFANFVLLNKGTKKKSPCNQLCHPSFISASAAKGTTLNCKVIFNWNIQVNCLLGMHLPRSAEHVLCFCTLREKKSKKTKTVLHSGYVYMCLYTYIHNTAINHTFSMCMNSSKLYTPMCAVV